MDSIDHYVMEAETKRDAAMVEADTRRQREDAIAAEVQRRQAIIDIYHEAKVVDEQRTRAGGGAHVPQRVGRCGLGYQIEGPRLRA